MTYYCWTCYGRNDKDGGVCEHCGHEISPPVTASTAQRLEWAIRHPDPDVAILATRRLSVEGDETSLPFIRAVIANPPDPYVAAEALRSLLALSDIDTERGLVERLAETGPLLLRHIASAALDGPT